MKSIDLIKKGVTTWNEWRWKNTEIINLRNVNLGGINLRVANLSGADLSEGNMVGTNFNKANLTECRIFGISAWDLKLLETSQLDLIVIGFIMMFWEIFINIYYC